METIPAEHSGSILTVDDEPSILTLLGTCLDAKGYRHRSAGTFEEMRRGMAEQSFDMVTLDVDMPDVTGLEALEWVRQNHPETGVVMVSGDNDLDTVIEAMRLGAYSYVTKPLNMELFDREIARAMERQRLLQENRSYQCDLERKIAERTRELSKANARLNDKIRELEGRDRLVQMQMSGRPLKEIEAGILEVICQVLGGDRLALYRTDAEGTLEQREALGDQAPAAGEGDMAAQVWAQRKTLRCDHGIMVPVIYDQDAIGVIWQASDRDCDTDALERLAREAALTLHMARITEAMDAGDIAIDELLAMDVHGK